jgi:hypothetical protein
MLRLGKGGDKAAAPSNRHFNIVINALAKSHEYLDARKAYDLLSQMQASETCTPDIISYTSVIECFSKSTEQDADQTSLHLLQEVTDVYEETKDPQMMPNLRTYTMVIKALATNPTLANVGKARELLTRLVGLYEETKDSRLQPSAFPYNYVLNCAANCLGSPEEKLRAFQTAAQTYNEMRKSDNVKPDSFTYAFWFKCCNNLLPAGPLRTKGVTYAFEECRKDGLVSPETFNRLLAGTPPDVVAILLGLQQATSPSIYRRFTLEDFPPSWSRNVK